MMNNELVPWRAPDANQLPSTAKLPRDFIPFAVALKPKEQHKVMQAIEQGLYDFATDFVWRRSLSRLKQTLSSLGMQFIGEMLGREDINEYSPPENVLTDWDAIRLAENLGVINFTGVLRLRHSFELLSHLSQPQTDEELEEAEAYNIIKNCVRYILSESDFGIAINFTRFRERLTSESLSKDDSQLQNIINSSPFFLTTALRVLLTGVKSETGARLDHCLNNFSITLPEIWERISEEDRWIVGTTYAEVANEGRNNVVAAIRRVLLSVSGFDYVPENLRSNTFRQAAKSVINAHFSKDNFFLETQPITLLSKLGTVIPRPALITCMQAYLCVYLGNMYGFSFGAAPVAETELKKISARYWNYYLNKALVADDLILAKLMERKPAERFIALVSDFGFNIELETDDSLVNGLIEAIRKKNTPRVTHIAKTLSLRLRGQRNSN